MELEHSDWEFAADAPRYLRAVEGQVGAALLAAKGGCEGDAFDLCQRIEEAIDVLKFALERDDRAN